MPRKDLQLRLTRIFFPVNETLALKLGGVDLDDQTPVSLKDFICEGKKCYHELLFPESAGPASFRELKKKVKDKVIFYPKVKGLHTLLLTGIEDGKLFTFRSDPIEIG